MVSKVIIVAGGTKQSALRIEGGRSRDCCGQVMGTMYGGCREFEGGSRWVLRWKGRTQWQ